jgi:hypothetical protein
MSDTRYTDYETLRSVGTDVTQEFGADDRGRSVLEQHRAGVDELAAPEVTTYVLDVLTPQRAMPDFDATWSTDELIVALALEGHSIHTVAGEVPLSPDEIETAAGEIHEELIENLEYKRSQLPDEAADDDPIFSEMAAVYDTLLRKLE